MISLLMSSSFLILSKSLSLNNPVAIKMSLMITSLILFFTMKVMSASSWLPMIFCMLYTGGILMMFMILSSLLPNSSMKSNKFLIPLFLMGLILTVSFISLPSFSTSNLKNFAEEKFNFIFVMIWILGTFFSFILLLSNYNCSLRSFSSF